jgi:hypothetical protein
MRLFNLDILIKSNTSLIITPITFVISGLKTKGQPESSDRLEAYVLSRVNVKVAKCLLSEGDFL